MTPEEDELSVAIELARDFAGQGEALKQIDGLDITQEDLLLAILDALIGIQDTLVAGLPGAIGPLDRGPEPPKPKPGGGRGRDDKLPPNITRFPNSQN